MAEKADSSSSGSSSRFWYGVAAGVGAVVLLIMAVMAIGVLAMGRCPMCGRMDMNGTGSGTANGEGMMGQGGMMGTDMPMASGSMPEWMMSRGPMADMMQDMPVIHQLLVNHEKIERQVENIPHGIRSVTTSDDPKVAGLIRKHVYQMKERLEQGKPIRMMDPVFREIFEHREKINMEIEEIPGGVRVTETSQDPQVVSLIRQHAHEAVSEFVEAGMQRAMRPTPLPEGYEADR